jgi:hypothetical protein
MSSSPTPLDVGVNNSAAAGVGSTELRIKQYISQHFLVNFGADADENTDLFEKGFIDSYGSPTMS